MRNIDIGKNASLAKYKIYFMNRCAKRNDEERLYFEFLLKLCPWVKTGVHNDVTNEYIYAQKKYVKPHIRKQCTIMLLTNLAEPEWISIDCNQKITGDIMCMVPRHVNVNTNISLEEKSVIYKNPCISITGKCYLFYWGYLNESLVSRHTRLNISKSTLIAMEYLVKATDTEFPPFHSFLYLMMYCKISRKWISHNFAESNKGLSIFWISGYKNIEFGNVFKCGQGILIAYAYVCDGKKDCPGDIAFDEIDCICNTNFSLSKKCKFIMSKERIKSCSLFYLTLKDGTCLVYGLAKINSPTTQAFTCKNDKVITLMVTNDHISDCSPSGDGEKHKTLDYNSNIICQRNGQLPCKGGHMECYNITEMCIYRLDKNNALIPCKTGEHVSSCKMIQCNMKFKCPGYYCIPWSYVCDGKWDCPGGFDEAEKLKCSNNRECRNMFKCRNSQICIHVGDVCNSLTDCPGEDDEHMCLLVGSVCPSPCYCIGLAVICYNVSYINYLVSDPPYIAVFLSYCDLTFLQVFLKIIKFPNFLSIRHNKLKSVCKILPGLNKTLTIDLGFNVIEYINIDCFINGFLLISIKLDNNLIYQLKRAVLLQLKKLRFLNLNNNLISALFWDNHISVPDLEILSIRNNRLSTISSNFFDDLNVNVVVTDKYFICCKTPLKSMCTSVQLWFESCKHLLLQRSITVCAFFYSFLLIFSNVLYNIFSEKITICQK